jgi:probable F420-dependent oxidoreductase
VKIYCHATLLPAEHLVALAQASESAGFFGLTIADHLLYPQELASTYPYADEPFPPDVPFPDTWVSIGAMAAATTTLNFASAIYIGLARQPVQVAKAVATAAIISGYRVQCGLGLGWMAEEFVHTHEQFNTRGRRFDEMVTLLREIWTGDWVDHHGRYYHYRPFKVTPAPRGPIPIWGSGEADPPLRRAARLDGWVSPNTFTMAQAAETVRRLQRLRREEGTADRDFEMVVGLRELPSVDDCRRLEELGVTAMTAQPWRPTANHPLDPGLDRVLDAVAEYGERVVSRV